MRIDENAKLEHAVDIAMDVIVCLDIPIGHNAYIKINNRYKRKWGLCEKLSTGWYGIQINGTLLDDRNGNLDGAVSTILHELIHTCVGCFNHGDIWSSYASKVNENTKYKVYEKSDYDDKQIAEEVIDSIEKDAFMRYLNHVTYTICCERCNRKRTYRRKCEVVNHPSDYSCGHCCGNLILK